MVRIHDGYTITREPLTLAIGIIGIVFGLFFILHRYNILPLSFDASNSFYVYFFAGYALVSGTILAYKATKKRI
ncbi:MAG TPA: hypothetical protein VEC16_04555 [Alphaproteobacteria bacterium]|nr:hypothetical protein [Alphaproteobacteria bacterium]